MKKTYVYKIKRFDPEAEATAGPERYETFSVEMEPTDRVLDGLIKIKGTLDGSLTFRSSCAHGVCGSCAMKINGKNALACQSLLNQMSTQTAVVEPLPSLTVIKDLVVDLEPFFALNELVMPYLINDEPPPERERLQSPEDQKQILGPITCIMCASCTTSCPVFWADKQYLGPSALLKAGRFVLDTRDRALGERMARLLGAHGLMRCHSIFNCAEVCPKEIDITGVITRLKRLSVRRGLGSGS